MASTQQQRWVEPAVVTPPSVIGTRQICKRVQPARCDAPFAARSDHMPPTTRETRVKTPTSITPTYETLSGIPGVDIPANVRAALATGRRATGIALEAAALRLGPGRLSPQEYFVYRLWDSSLPLAAKRAYVGKLAQHPMHVAAGSREWYACSADKILFHIIMAGGRFRVAETVAIT